jgi:hypothetical protein
MPSRKWPACSDPRHDAGRVGTDTAEAGRVPSADPPAGGHDRARLHLAGADLKKDRTYGPQGRSYAARCSIGPVAADHTGRTGPFRPLSSRPEDAVNHQERRAWDIWDLAIFHGAGPGGFRPPPCTGSAARPGSTTERARKIW